MFRTTIYLTEELHKKLKLWAVEHDQTMSEVIMMSLTTAAIFIEKGKNATRTPKIIEQAKTMTEDLKEFQAGLVKPRGEIHGEDYI